MSPCLAFPLATKPALCQCGVCRMEKLSWKYIRESRGEAGRKTHLKFACEKGGTNLSLTRDLPKQPLPWSHNPGGSGSTAMRAAHGAPSRACSRGLASCRRGLCPGTTRRDAGEPQGLYMCCGTQRGTGCSLGQSFWQQCVPYTAAPPPSYHWRHLHHAGIQPHVGPPCAVGAFRAVVPAPNWAPGMSGGHVACTGKGTGNIKPLGRTRAAGGKGPWSRAACQPSFCVPTLLEVTVLPFPPSPPLFSLKQHQVFCLLSKCYISTELQLGKAARERCKEPGKQPCHSEGIVIYTERTVFLIKKKNVLKEVFLGKDILRAMF